MSYKHPLVLLLLAHKPLDHYRHFSILMSVASSVRQYLLILKTENTAASVGEK